ncbi:MAG: GNAT family N-acetyltransferase [Dysgonomonas sp.]
MIAIRKIKDEEINILKDMLYEAIYQAEDKPLIPKDIIENPEINVYIENFGKKQDDHCLIAETDGKIVGAVWVRILADEIKGFGNIDNQTPEFAISLFKEYRNRGYGTMLMKEMIGHLKNKGYNQASLSVNRDNYAVHMYQKLGFSIIKENKDDFLMLLDLEELTIIK